VTSAFHDLALREEGRQFAAHASDVQDAAIRKERGLEREPRPGGLGHVEVALAPAHFEMVGRGEITLLRQ
jgi:hypothetical protein